MAHLLRIELAGTIYHAMSRGNARQKVFRNQPDNRRFLEGLEATVSKFGFEISSLSACPITFTFFSCS